MPNIHVYRYKDPANVAGWAGWIEPEDKSWILFVRLDGGAPMLFRREDGELVGVQSSAVVDV